MFVNTAMVGTTSRFICVKKKYLDFKNTYLVVSFLTGFSIMEFLKMLRRVSKIMFEGKPKSA